MAGGLNPLARSCDDCVTGKLHRHACSSRARFGEIGVAVSCRDGYGVGVHSGTLAFGVMLTGSFLKQGYNGSDAARTVRKAQIVRQSGLQHGEVQRLDPHQVARFSTNHDVGRSAKGMLADTRVPVGEPEDRFASANWPGRLLSTGGTSTRPSRTCPQA
jgi:hypothetical protein